jgi:hypothetical protein
MTWYVPAGTKLDRFRAWLPAMGASVKLYELSLGRQQIICRDLGLLRENWSVLS